MSFMHWELPKLSCVRQFDFGDPTRIIWDIPVFICMSVGIFIPIDWVGIASLPVKGLSESKFQSKGGIMPSIEGGGECR